jgi:O-acetyl-ADP-ribose deacetylase (regulator of RNase III)
LQGILNFENMIRKEGGVETSWGTVHVSGSGGGRSENLIHVVGMGSSREELAEYTLKFVVSAALQAAAQSEFRRIVLAPFLIDEIGGFSAEKVARMMFKSVYYHWSNDQVFMPKHVLIAVEDEATYPDFKRVLEAEAPFIEGDEAADETTGDVENKALTKKPETKDPEEDNGSISRTIRELKPLALTAFFFAIRRKGGTMRERCEELYFFDRIKHLFTEKGGEELHPHTIEKVERRFNGLD